MKKFGIFLVGILAIMIFPRNVFAETVEVRLRESEMYDAQVIETVEAEKSVTTLAQIKQAFVAKGVNLDNYMFFDDFGEELEDTSIVCEGNLNCYGSNNELYFWLTGWKIDNTEIKITLNSIPPVSVEMFQDITQTNWELLPEGASYKSCNDSFTLCTFLNHSTFKVHKNVVFVYNYNQSIYNLAKIIIDSGALDDVEFKTTDTELLHYLNYGGSLANYTSAFKKKIANTNFDAKLDQRAGGAAPFLTEAAGFYKFMYKNTLYGVKSFVNIVAEHVLYVPTDTTDIKKAIEDRLTTLFGTENKLTVSKCTKTINQVLEDYEEDPVEYGDEYCYVLSKEVRVAVGEDEHGNVEYDTDTRDYYFRVIKDSSKINNTIAFKSSDLVTNVSVSTDGRLPLDTLVVVSKLTSGKTYTDLLKLLDADDGEVYDIDLHSSAQDKTIKELPNGKFLVSIPVPDKYEGKTLAVYYADSNNHVTEYEVTIKDGYATFETDHFSTYTLTEKVDSLDAINATSNPATGDNIMLYVILLSVSAVALAGTTLYIKKSTKN